MESHIQSNQKNKSRTRRTKKRIPSPMEILQGQTKSHQNRQRTIPNNTHRNKETSKSQNQLQKIQKAIQITNHRETGIKAEREFIKILNKEGIPYEYLDAEFDFIINNTFVDVKSTQISHKFTNKNKKTQSYKVGRFDLTTNQREEQCYLALFARFKENFLFLGMMKSNKNSPRYISLHKIREQKILTIEEFLNQTER